MNLAKNLSFPILFLIVINFACPNSSQAQLSGLCTGWPPSPLCIVNLDSADLSGNDNSTIVVQPAGETSIYTVPNNKYLVLTNVEFHRRNCYVTNNHETICNESHPPVVTLAERLGSALTPKRGFRFLGADLVHSDPSTYGDSIDDNYTPSAVSTYSSAVGLVFSPGSQVVVVNHSLNLEKDLYYTITGYLRTVILAPSPVVKEP